jgi:FAD-linked sulfhydryl oxidase
MPSVAPELWGPSTWRAIHFAALGYPSEPTEDDVTVYGAFFETLQRVLPCESCAVNYSKHLSELPIEPFLRSGRLFEWTVRLHNIVNRELGKRRWDWTPEQAIAELSAAAAAAASHPSRSSSTGTSLPLVYALIIAIVAAIVGAAVALFAVAALRS